MVQSRGWVRRSRRAASVKTTRRLERPRRPAHDDRGVAEAWPDRDHAAFARFIADEAIFFSGPTPLRGRQPVIDFWARFYAGPKAPFSWEPDEVEVLDGGTLALSSGPVRNPDGKLVARFTSVWRRTPAGRWEIVFDKGSEVCDCAPQAGVPPALRP